MRRLPPYLQAGWLRLREALHLQDKRSWWKGGSIIFLILLGTFAVTKILFAQGTNIEPGWVDKLLLIIAGYAMALAGALTQGIVICVDLAIRLMMYNGFVTSPVVGAGWSIVRDAMNMFFVIVLIAIAVMTIFGRSKINWQQQVPRLLLFAIVINFSRTLCGIMIDISQVVMMTFANALRNIAAGNFIQMFGLNKIYLISQSSTVIQDVAETSSAPVAYDWFAAGILAVFMVIMVLSVVLALVAILAWRIVTLWVLVTISPLSWFMGGVSGVFSQAKGYTEWWTRFICATAIGPVITFFLWLTLAVAGAGNLAARGGFVSTTEQSNLNVSGNLSSIFEVENLISFVLGMGMLYAGFEAASSICSGGFVGQAMGKAKGVAPAIAKGLQKFAVQKTKAAGGAVTKQFKAAGGAVMGLGLKGARKLGAGAKMVGGRIGRDVGEAVSDVEGLKYFTKKGRAGLYRDIARRTRSGKGVTGLAGRFVSRRADIWGEQLERARQAEAKEMGKGYEGMGTESKINELHRLMGGFGLPTERLKSQHLFLEMAATADGRRRLSLAGITDQFWKKNGAEMEEKFKNDPEMVGKLEAFKKARTDLTKTGMAGIKTWEDVTALDAEAIEGLTTTVNKDGVRERDDAKFEAFKKHLSSFDSNKKGVNAWEYLSGQNKEEGKESKGTYNKNFRDILEGATARSVRFANANAQDLATFSDEELVEHASGRGVKENGHIRERLLRSRMARQIKDPHARDALSEAVATAKPGDVGEYLRENPLLIGVIGDKHMGEITGDDAKLGSAHVALLDRKNRAQINAAVRSDPGGSEQLQQNVSRILAAQLARATDVQTRQAVEAHLNEFLTQVRSMHTAEAEALRNITTPLGSEQEERRRTEVTLEDHTSEKLTLESRQGTAAAQAGDADRLVQLATIIPSIERKLQQLDSSIADLETRRAAKQQEAQQAIKPILDGVASEIQRLQDTITAEATKRGVVDIMADPELKKLDEAMKRLEARQQELKDRPFG